MSIPTEVAVALITVFGGGVISLLLALMKVVLKVNDAVNDRHKKPLESGEIPPKLFDMVYENNTLIKETNMALLKLTDKCNTIENTMNTEVFSRIQTMESRQNFFVQQLKEILKKRTKGKNPMMPEVSFAEEEINLDGENQDG